MKKNNQKGFTLIELLVVIAIIGLLSTMAVVSLNSARAKARDAKRVSDVKQMTTLLSLAASEVPDAYLICDDNNTTGTMTAVPATEAVCVDGDSTQDILRGINLSGDTISDPNLNYEFEKFEDPTGYDSTDVVGPNDNACLVGDTAPCQYGLETDPTTNGLTNTIEKIKILFYTEGQVGDLSANTVHEITSEGVMVDVATAIP